MFELILYAIPFFVATLAVEWLQFRHDTEERRAELVGYGTNDTLTSLAMGAGNVVANAAWKVVVVAAYAAIYELTPLRIPSDAWWAWVALFLADEIAYYWYHRLSHTVRLFWASHVVHHSSQHYNLSTALRQPWTPMTYFIFWLPLAAVGFPPWMILLEQSISLTFQFFIHTERVKRLPAPIEWVFNTPSHHRGHHGSNDIYLDKNYGGILIVWDRLFGTFQPETERVVYGLTHNLETFNPVEVATHEWKAMSATSATPTAGENDSATCSGSLGGRGRGARREGRSRVGPARGGRLVHGPGRLWPWPRRPGTRGEDEGSRARHRSGTDVGRGHGDVGRSVFLPSSSGPGPCPVRSTGS